MVVVQKIDHQNIAYDLIQESKKKGADKVEVVYITGADCSIEVRNGAVVGNDFSEAQTIGIRVLIGQKSATVSGSDFSAQGLSEMVERAIATAKILPEDPYTDIADANLLSQNHVQIDNICDPITQELEVLKEKATIAEEKALSIKGITNSEGAGCSFGRYQMTLATSNGFNGSYEKTIAGLSCSVLAGEGVDMQRDYDYSTACLFDNLKKPELIGQEAAEKAIKKLNPVKMKSGAYPVIYDKRVGRSLLGYFSGAISADSIYRGVSFIENKVGEKVFSDAVKIVDDPHLSNGLASVPFDAEGVNNPKLTLVENGILKGLLVDCASGRKIKMPSNGRARRSAGGLPHPGATNMYILPGKQTAIELMSDIKYGLYVTETIGHGINSVTGDYSIGAAGFLIENGVLTIPVSEITIAGNLKNIFLNITPANDLVFESRKNVPTLRVDGLTIAGN